MRIALLTIATNKYVQFAPALYESVDKFFLKGHAVDIYLFTNHTTDQSKVIEDLRRKYQTFDQGQAYGHVALHVIDQAHMPWPHMTLKRYHIFQQHWFSHLSFYDYVYYCDIDMLFVADVGDEILGDLVATCHPGFFNKPRPAWTYETRPASRAYIAPHEGWMYFAGGFQGGSTSCYHHVITNIAKAIDEDLAQNVIAVWHDESHWNRYLINHPPTNVLSPAYCYPESWLLPFPRKLLALDKDHIEFRKEE